MKNERGMTLIEVLAAVTISAIVLGGATMLVSSIYSSFFSTSQKYDDDTSINRVVSRITSSVSDCKQLAVLPNELRCLNSSGSYKSFLYDPGEHKLTYREMNAALTVTNSMELSSIVAENPVALDATSNPVTQGTIFNNGQLVTLKFIFEPTRVTSTGSRTALPQETSTIRIKLLKDY